MQFSIQVIIMDCVLKVMDWIGF